MIRNYFKTAFRNLRRNKSYAFINVLGLAVGIAACLLIFLVIQFETSFDKFHSKRESIYRLGSAFHNQDGVSYSAGIPFPVGPALRLDFPQLKEVACIFKRGTEQVTIENNGNNRTKKFTEDIYFSEPQFFKMFDFAWLNGSPESSLKEPNSVVLTEKKAEKNFGVGKFQFEQQIKYNNKEIYKITGILKNIPA